MPNGSKVAAERRFAYSMPAVERLVLDTARFLAGMEDGQFREAESEEQKSLPFNFRAPRLQLTQDKSQARIFWQSQGQIIADHKQQMVKSIGKDNRTSLY